MEETYYDEDKDEGLIEIPDDCDFHVFGMLDCLLWHAFEISDDDDKWNIASYRNYICMNIEKFTMTGEKNGMGSSEKIVKLGKISKYIIKGYERIKKENKTVSSNYADIAELHGLYDEATNHFKKMKFTS